MIQKLEKASENTMTCAVIHIAGRSTFAYTRLGFEPVLRYTKPDTI